MSPGVPRRKTGGLPAESPAGLPQEYSSGGVLVVDAKTGRMYVGSATGNKGIWQRWCGYIETGHGGNKELKALLKKRGPHYVRNFRFTVLEIADFHATDNDIIVREQHWKTALLSRAHGHNLN